MRTRFLPVWLLAVALMGAGWWQSSHHAAHAATTYYVTSNADSGTGSLRTAITDANAAAGADDIHIITAGPIALSSQLPAITGDVTIAGPNLPVSAGGPGGQVIIQQNGAGRIFEITSGTTVEMNHLYITGGQVVGADSSTASGGDAMGGGILNHGDLTLILSTVTGNSVAGGNSTFATGHGGNAYGGGIYSDGTLTLTKSTVSNNIAYGGNGDNTTLVIPFPIPIPDGNNGVGGGVFSEGTTTIEYSTISNNIVQGGNSVAASGYGGAGAGSGIAIYSSGALSISNATVSGNVALGGSGDTGGSAAGGGVGVVQGTFTSLNVTISNNSINAGSGTTAGAAEGAGLAHVSTTAATLNNTMVAGDSGGNSDFYHPVGSYSGNGNFLNGSPLLNPLADNGGPTQTMKPASGSLVINAGTFATSGLDQRGAPRVSGLYSDAGAVEVGATVPTYTAPVISGLAPFTVSGTTAYPFPAGTFTGLSGASGIDGIKIVSLPTNGSLSLNGQTLSVGSFIPTIDLDDLVYTPNPGNTETTDAFLWQGGDEDGGLSNVVVNNNAPPNTSSATNEPPVITASPATITVVAGTVETVTLHATDPDTGETLTIQQTGTLDAFVTPDHALPSVNEGDVHLTINPVIADVQQNPYYENFKVTDSGGLISFISVAITVIYPDNAAPTIDTIVQSPVHILQGDTFEQIFHASDPDYSLPPDFHLETLTFRAVLIGGQLASGLPVTPQVNIGTWTDIDFQQFPTGTERTSKFDWTPTSGPGTYNLNVSVYDSRVPIEYWGYTFTLIVDPDPTTTNAPPIITNPGDQTVAVNNNYSLQIVAQDADGDPMVYSATNLPAGLQIDGDGLITGIPTAVGTNSVTINVSDSFHPQPSTMTFDIKVVASGDPTLNITPGVNSPEFVKLGESFTRLLTSQDNVPFDTLTFSVKIVGPSGLVSLPSNTLAAYNQESDSSGTSASATFNWTPLASGTYVVTVKVQNEQGKVEQRQFTIRVSSPPSLSLSPSGGVYDVDPDMPFTLDAIIVDADNNESLALSLNGAPSGMSFVGQSTFANLPSGTSKTVALIWAPSASDANQSFDFDIIVTDGANLMDIEHVTINVGPVNDPPFISNPGDQHSVNGHTVSLQIYAFDFSFPADTLVYGANNLPTGLSIDASTGEITGTPSANGVYTVTITVDDGHHVSPAASVNFDWKIDNINGIPETVGTIPDQFISVGQSFSFDVTSYFSDPDNDALTYHDSFSLAPAGLVLDANTGIISGTASPVGTYPITITATDGYATSPAQTFNVTVQANQAPTLQPIADVVLHTGESLNVQASATDPEGDPISYSVSGLPTWASMDAAGLITGTADANYTSYTVTVTATDSVNLGSDSETFTITVQSPFSGTIDTSSGYATITYTLINSTSDPIQPIVQGSLTGGGYTDNENAFFSPSQGIVDSEWASPRIERKLNPTKNTRILTWTVGTLEPGESATLNLAVPYSSNMPVTQEFTDQWTVSYGTNSGPVTFSIDPMTQLSPPTP